MKKILDLDMKVFGLQIWVTLYILLDLDWKPFGQRFIIILTTIFTNRDFEILGLQSLITITIFLRIWTLIYLDYGLDFDCYLPY